MVQQNSEIFSKRETRDFDNPYRIESIFEYLDGDTTGLTTWGKKLEQLRGAVSIVVEWDGRSAEGLFQLGMAFALRKSIQLHSIPEFDPQAKSFPRMITQWQLHPEFEVVRDDLVGKKIFVICPVRNQSAEIGQLLEQLASDDSVYYPAWHTNQLDSETGGLRICADNRTAIEGAEAVWFVWDGQSQGSIFDLGMAFALGKPIIVKQIPPLSSGPSFQNFVEQLENFSQR